MQTNMLTTSSTSDKRLCMKTGIRLSVLRLDKPALRHGRTCDAYLKHLQFDDENKSWHISAESFTPSHAKLPAGEGLGVGVRMYICIHMCVRVCV